MSLAEGLDIKVLTDAHHGRWNAHDCNANARFDVPQLGVMFTLILSYITALSPKSNSKLMIGYHVYAACTVYSERTYVYCCMLQQKVIVMRMLNHTFDFNLKQEEQRRSLTSSKRISLSYRSCYFDMEKTTMGPQRKKFSDLRNRSNLSHLVLGMSHCSIF